MWIILFGVFLILHGLVHLLYAGQSLRFYELVAGFTWPDGAWLFSKFLSDEIIRSLTSLLLGISALGFVISGIGLFLRVDWWRNVAIGSAVFSSLLFFVLWNGKWQALDNQGGIGILINLAILIVILVFNWPI